ncbi:uracil-DNA glycosylase [Burkholderia stagnalis]|uniref:Uracil-DNA glycosylase n=1 Tax=Burkholderia stagnalis TaxID=1503054 RepID=A0ABX9YD72_9BURK|nr:uracil-DNA glycosylase [Burkholderia stagnalis]KVC59320.1 uracil-DNA glycosylase [Burkholderia stagnalis]KVL87524.1 uracil-DNA glycosylase [Burkholderia stagnalis]KVL97580.1 uracil-DNA glycosylase [Burkholderia stagnalis]KVM14998.1 uracil-DNA glycosylase [Burkholderia stagnalis]KVN22599.1 uracil-DNA glycosylase [Burkholderia stagnalis]
MATRKTPRAPQQASLFDDPVLDTPTGSAPADAPAAPAAPIAAATPATPASTAAPAAPSPAASDDVLHLAAQFDALPAAWRAVLAPFVAGDAYAPLCSFVDSERAAGKTVYPADVFRALRLTSPDDVKVVILGQDPYHGDDRGTPQAHGLAFSVPPAVRPPPSLRNIFKEIAANFGHDTPRHGCLDTWARQGVLLLNTVLTVERGAAASHAKRGWEQCTDTLIRELASRHRGLVFMLWGAHAQAKRALFDANAHCVLEAPHPSPLSAHRGFLGCRHFALANDYLVEQGREPIDWRLPDEAETFA